MTNPMSATDPINEFWFRHPDLMEYAEQRMATEKLKLHTIKDVKTLQAQFKPIYEIVAFNPTIEIVFARNLVGECKSAAVLGKWSLEQIGIEAVLVDLCGNNIEPHRICMSTDHTILIVNKEVWTGINSELWQNEVFSLFKWKYNTVKER
jgi:hypothetical protein